MEYNIRMRIDFLETIIAKNKNVFPSLQLK